MKKPEESRAPFDYYKLLQTTPAGEAFRPLAEGAARWCGPDGAAVRRHQPRRQVWAAGDQRLLDS
ncbi:hypothetical protein ACFQY5_02370 [Paeniroseomonas aquatica]|uniref:hypothetical protein n=1 Tax=Paeniroseomonas aquatica TaxID=373043 RepID=UPI00360976F1